MPPLRRRSLLFALGFAALAWSGVARADKVYLKTGKVVEGKIVSDDAEGLTIKTETGITARFPHSKVDRVEKGLTPREQYRAMLEDLDGAEDQRQVARFCVEHKLSKEAAEHYQKVIEELPDDREARDFLGHVRTPSGWMSRDDYMKSLGLVRYKGAWVSEAEKDLRVAAEKARKDRSKVRRLVRDAVHHSKPERRLKAQDELLKYSDRSVQKPFRSALMSASKEERLFVLNQIAKRGTKGFSKMLSRTIIADPVRKNRHTALNVLESKKDPDSALYFTAALGAQDPVLRINATNAVRRFPDARVVNSLIVTLRMESAGFGKVHTSIVTQRAYIADYELSSGGTGLTVAEVADPVIGTFQEGVVLEVKIRKVEWESKIEVLGYITGQSYGASQTAWANYYNSNKGEIALSPKAKARREAWLSKSSD